MSTNDISEEDNSSILMEHEEIEKIFKDIRKFERKIKEFEIEDEDFIDDHYSEIEITEPIKNEIEDEEEVEEEPTSAGKIVGISKLRQEIESTHEEITIGHEGEIQKPGLNM